jgi:hypothetical protein
LPASHDFHQEQTAMTPKRGLTIHFNDGTSITIEFPQQTTNVHARKLLEEEILKRRFLIAEAEGALLYIPFENVKYFTVFPADGELPKTAIRGASITA